jgi:hypothetical protein
MGLFLVLLPALARADERSQQMVAQLAHHAAAYHQTAPTLVGRERLEQSAFAGEGKAWKQRTIESQYLLSTFADGNLHELRQVVAVDGKPVKATNARALASLLLNPTEDAKQRLLKQFADRGLRGAVTDLAPLLLLFTPTSIVRYEFDFLRTDQVGGTGVDVFRYHQVDGSEALTLYNAKGREGRNLALSGELWVDRDGVPLRISLVAEVGDLRQEAEVDYAPSLLGSVLPTAVRHRELRQGMPVAENHFTYQHFQAPGTQQP